MSRTTVTTEEVRALARLQAIDLPEEDIGPLAAAFADHLSAIAAIDALLDVSDFEPALSFNPLWT